MWKKNKAKECLIYDLSLFTLLWALMLRVFGAKVFYINIVFSSEKDKWMKILDIIGIQIMGNSVSLPDGAHWQCVRLSKKYTDKVFSEISSSSAYALVVSKICGKEDCSDACSVVIKSTIYQIAFKVANIVVFGSSYISDQKEYAEFPTVICDNNFVTRVIFREEGIRNIEPSILFIWKIVIEVLYKVFLSLGRKVLQLFRKEHNNDSIHEDRSEYEIIYFPHRGVKYAEMFVKDHYYSDDNESPLFPKNILHLGLRDDDEVISKNKDYYKNRQITNKDFYDYSGLPYREIFALVRWFVFSGVFLRLWKGFGFYCPALCFYIVLSVENNKKRLSDINPKLALVGYDFLFPKTLSLACRINGVVTVAIQERYILAWQNPYMIIDHYFAIGEPVVSSMQGSRDNAVTNYYVIGSVRKDLIIKEMSWLGGKEALFGAEYKYIAVFFDTHTENSAYINERVGYNIIVNKTFYIMALRIAMSYPDTYFLIKGKDYGFIQMNEYRDIIEWIDSLPNIEVITDYIKWTPYRTAAVADYAVAIQNSLCDEMLQSGKPVIYFAPAYLQRPSEYNELCDDLIVTNEEDLHHRITEIRNGFVSRYKTVADNMYYSNTGSVKDRLSSELNTIVGSLELPAVPS